MSRDTELPHRGPLWLRFGVMHDAWPGVLLPQLAQLAHLEALNILLQHVRLRDPIPAAWGAPGAFPRLKRCGARVGMRCRRRQH